MISANGVEYKNVPEQVQYLTEQVADIWTAIAGINPPDLTLYALKTYVDAADSALGTRITAVENSIGTLLTKTEAANTYAKIADIGTYINLSDYVKTVDMYTYVQAEIQNFDMDSNTDFTALKSRVSTLESSVSSMTSDIADANATAANAQTAAGNAVNTANNASAVATNAYNTAASAASDVADMQTTINNYDSRIDAVESTVNGFQASLNTAQNTANAALAKADSALSMIAGLHSLTKQEAEFEGDSVTVTGFVEGSLCTLTKLEGNTKASENLINPNDIAISVTSGSLTLDNNFDGSFRLHGTVASESNAFTLTNNLSVLRKMFVNGGTYIGYVENGSNISLQTWDVDNGVQRFFFNGTPTAVTNYKVPTATQNNFALVYFGAIGDEVDITIKPMVVAGSTAPTEFVPHYDGLKSVSISGLSSGGGVVITTSEGTTSLVPTLDVDTLELRAYDYLEQTISGTVIITSLVRKSGIVDLGTLNWYYQTINNLPTFTAQLALAKPTSDNNSVSKLITGLYTSVSPNTNYIGGDKIISLAGVGSNFIWLKDSSYTDAAAFKTAMSGVLLVYELATPVTTVLATVTYTDVSAFFEAGAAITVNNANTEYGVESTSTMYGYVAE